MRRRGRPRKVRVESNPPERISRQKTLSLSLDDDRLRQRHRPSSAAATRPRHELPPPSTNTTTTPRPHRVLPPPSSTTTTTNAVAELQLFLHRTTTTTTATPPPPSKTLTLRKSTDKDAVEKEMIIPATIVPRETSREEVIHTICVPPMSSLTQNSKNELSTEDFKGLCIKPDLIPTLKEIWSKHGNLLENSILRNRDIIARALESLATVVHILQGHSARSLNDIQADYLSTSLSDLQSMSFKVDWLVPCVEKALALYRSKSLLDSLKKLGQFRAQVALVKSKLSDELIKLEQMEQEVGGDISLVTERLPLCGQFDFDKPLGGELL